MALTSCSKLFMKLPVKRLSAKLEVGYGLGKNKSVTKLILIAKRLQDGFLLVRGSSTRQSGSAKLSETSDLN